MARKMKSVELFGIEGTGETLADAKKNAGDKLTSLVQELRAPQFLFDGADIVCIYRDVDCWAYSFLRNGKLEATHFADSYAEAYKSAAFHIAQNNLDCDRCISAADVPVYVTDAHDRSELVSYCQWQRAARHAKQVLGIEGSNEVHSYACQHATEFARMLSTGQHIAA